MAKKLHILTVIRNPVGGIRTYLKYTYGYLDRDRYRFTILMVRTPEGRLIKEDLKGFELDFSEVEGKFILWKMVWKLFQAVTREEFDLIHSQGFTAGALAVIGNWISRKKHIMISHDVFRKNQFPGIRGWIKKSILGILFTKPDVIQSVSYDAQENLVEFLPILKKRIERLRVIHNGIKVDDLEVDEMEGGDHFRQDVGIDVNSFLFGFLGRFMEQKGFVYLIEAVEELDKEREFQDRFKVLAVNDGAYIREYKKEIGDRGLQRYFHFYGFVPDGRKIIRCLDALVIPSLWEAYGLVAAEGFVLGCAVIASDCIGLREVTKGTPAIIIKKADSKSLFNGLRIMMQERDEYKRKAIAFIPEARRRFDSRKTARLLNDLFLGMSPPH